ncbi:hypothetical protein F944_01758 [Acinetobacter ursingii DSM 16037 = CIP 107286]|nr:hypothetical protein F944_01758 [Acinetobacter ursingii DSM 16037 = CIP 107286]VTX79648.1 Uncharacterised protein [Acinetobacter ursingii]
MEIMYKDCDFKGFSSSKKHQNVITLSNYIVMLPNQPFFKSGC